MKPLSPSIAKTLLLGSILIASGAVYLSVHQGAQVAVLVQREAQARRADNQAAVALQMIRPVLNERSPAQPIDQAVAETLYVLLHSANKNRVRIGSTLAQAASRGIAGTVLKAQPVAGTHLLSVQLTVKGGYQDYLGLLAFLHRIKQLPVTLSEIDIQGADFSLALTVYGR